MLPQAQDNLMTSIIVQESITKHKRLMQKKRDEILQLDHQRKGEIYKQ